MKLVTSTGDFAWYQDSVAERIACYEGGKFRYLNLEMPVLPELMNDGEDWRHLADAWSKAAEKAGVTFVVAHAPCLHIPILNDEETYRRNTRAIRRSIELCHLLGIGRVVVHASACKEFTPEQFRQYNKKFYQNVLEPAEKHSITVMTENWDGYEYHCSTGKQLREFLDDMNHPLLAACWDTAHANIDPTTRQIGQYENILALGDKLKGVHIADNFGDSHHHTWPFAGVIQFDSVMQGLLDVNYDGYFTFEASYSLLHSKNPPFGRQAWEHNGQVVTKLHSPSLELKKQAVDLLYEVGRHMLTSYDCYEE
ncbi:MAG: sugar phosphate isomerase/epimerase [Oscillospiraceae bacterium]|nr:sugar phosphate isomerase/epimerase [Oscillospiraceae bacterium]MBQ5749093.1 sugar phosphate isomerase/epimerase [Oscillospiraceae bacterium]